MHRRVATHVATLLVGMGLGLGAVSVADQGPAARSSASDTNIVRELRSISKKLDLTNHNLGGYTTLSTGPSVKDYLENIDKNIAAGGR